MCVKLQTTNRTQRFHFLIFPCLVERMVLPLIMKTEKTFKQDKKLKFTQFSNFKTALGKSAFLKFAAQVFEAGDFLILS